MINKELINQSIDYMLEHLDESLSVKDVANHIHYSEYYFSRAFKAVTGESVYAFVKRLKMNQSAIDIKLKTNKTITDIGLDYGYSSSNYSSAFKQHHSISPTGFRESTPVTRIANPFRPETFDCFETYDAYDRKIKIETLGNIWVVYERMIGNYEDLKEKWFQFMERYSKYIRQDTLMIEKFYDDPVIASLNRCICDLCITIDETCRLENITRIKGGKFAVYRFEGEIKDIFRTLQGIFSIWLPKSSYEMGERYGLNIYRKIDRETGFVIMDLCIPIK